MKIRTFIRLLMVTALLWQVKPARAIDGSYSDEGGGTYWCKVWVSSTSGGHSYSWWTGRGEDTEMEHFRGFNSEHNGDITTEYPSIKIRFRYHYGQAKDFKRDGCSHQFYVRLKNGMLTRVGEIREGSWDLINTNTNYGRLGDCSHDEEWITLRYVPNDAGVREVDGFQVEGHHNYKQSNFWTKDGHIQIKTIYLRDLHMNLSEAKEPTIDWISPGKLKVSVDNSWLPSTIGNNVQDYEFKSSYKVTVYVKNEQDIYATGSMIELNRGNGSIELKVPMDEDFTVNVDRMSQATFKFEGNEMSQNSNNAVSFSKTYNNTPVKLRADFNQVTGEVRLEWDDYGDAVRNEGDYQVYRTTLTDDGASYSGNREFLGSTSKNYFVDNRDHGMDYGKRYRYEVFQQKKSWGEISIPSNPEPLTAVKASEARVNTIPVIPLHLVQDQSVTSSIKLDWSFGNVPNTDNDITFKIHRIEPDGTVNRNYNEVSVPRSAGKATFSDSKPTDNCTLYGYFAQLDLIGGKIHIYSDTIYAHVLDGSTVTGVTTSKGNAGNTVQVKWTAKQVGSDPTLFVVQRRFIGSSDWTTLHQQEGTGASYTFTDSNVEPGRYYEYRVQALGKDCSGSGRVVNNDMRDVGFGQATGVISGRVEYSTGTAVKDVTINLTRDGDESDRSQFYSRRITDAGSGLKWKPDIKAARELIAANKPWSLQMWVSIDNNLATDLGNNGATMVPIATLPGIGELSITELADNDSVMIDWTTKRKINEAESETILSVRQKVSLNGFNHLTVSHDGKGGYTLSTINDKKVVSETASNATAADESKLMLQDRDGKAELTFGAVDEGSLTTRDEKKSFIGYLDEIRLWSRALSANDISGNYNRLLSGREDGLKLYWTFDEGLEEYAFDNSYTSGTPNSNHPEVGNNTRPSNITPSAEQFSLYGLTNDKGEYEIRGIPFAGSGSHYSVIPTLGVHNFSPTSRSAFISPSPLTINNVDFTDVSSVKVRGTIRFAGTTIPEDSVSFYVDGAPCNKNNVLIYSDKNGEYEISVPIGNHFIEVRRSGHTFVDGGRYPAEQGSSYNFVSDTNLDFYDNTLVVFAGRITGGSNEGKKPLGYGLSQNTIGKTTLKIQSLDHPQRMINAVEQVRGTTREWVPNPQTVELSNKNGSIKSSSYLGGGDEDDAKYIYITTDEKTGEFCAMVPPLRYAVKSVSIPKNEAVQNDAIFKTIPMIDITNPLDTIRPDTAYVEPGHVALPVFKCNRNLRLTYRSRPVIDITQVGAAAGAFGTDTLTVSDNNNELKLPVYEVDQSTGAVTYKYKYPIFEQSRTYEFKVTAYEPYTNNDSSTPKLFRDALADSVVTFDNEIGSMAQVAAEDATKEGNNIKRGDLMSQEESSVKLDNEGKGTYKWTAGMPNLTAPYTRSINASMVIEGQTVLWRQNGLESVVSGVVPTGNNFITAGPSYVQMVLRDPPGDSSTATWEVDTISTKYSYHNRGIHQNTDLGLTFSTGVTTAVGTGIGVFTLVNTDLIHENSGFWKYEVNKTWDNRSYTTFTTSHAISTSSDNRHVGRDGDVFVGYSTNYIVGAADHVGLLKSTDGTWGIGLEESMNVSEKFSTVFNYSQKHIETTLFDNITRTRNTKLTKVKSKSEILEDPPVVTYYTLLDEGDPKFGTSNDDKSVWGDKAQSDPKSDEQPSYYYRYPVGYGGCDSVQWCNEIIRLWKEKLAENEEDKLKAFSNESKYKLFNKSFENGTTVTDTKITTDREQSNSTQYFTTTIGYKGKNGVKVSSVGFVINTDVSIGYHETIGKIDEKTYQKKFSYTLNDTQRNNAHTVDIYNSPKGWGPIFRTRAGQTRCPYEGETRTKYYNPGTLLDYATMKMDNPKISMPVRNFTDIPAGQEAQIQVALTNESETNDITSVLIYVDPTSNPKGLQVYIDGEPMVKRTEIWLDYGQRIVKNLTIKQSDASVLDYENIKLILHSSCEVSKIYDTVEFSAHFVPAAPPVTLSLNKTVLNKKAADGNEPVVVTIKDINRMFNGLKGVRLKYRFAGDANWVTAHEWLMKKEYIPSGGTEAVYSLMPDNTPNITYTLDLPNIDGEYVIQAESFCTFAGKDVTQPTAEITVVRDTRGPKLLGQAMPNSGILYPQDDIMVMFNEKIRESYLNKDGNFFITGVLNDAPIDHEVSLQLNGEKISTQAYLPINNTDFSTSFWLKRQTDGTILEHSNLSNLFSLGVDSEGHAVLNMSNMIGSMPHKSTSVIPKDKWVFVGLSYRKPVEGIGAKVDAFVAEDGTVTQLFDNIDVETYNNEATVSVGDAMHGSIQELTFWNKAMSRTALLELKNQQLASYTPGLVGYWKMDEGHNNVITDYARSRHMYSATPSWNIDNTNLAAHFDGSHDMEVNISQLDSRITDSFVTELWFRGEKDSNNGATLISITDRLSLDFDELGGMVLHTYDADKNQSSLTTNGTSYQLTDVKYNDGQWHHMALNVHRGFNATVFIDGEAVRTLDEHIVPAVTGNYLHVGSILKTEGAESKHSHYFSGDIDELRIWNSATDAATIKARVYQMIDTAKVSGLAAYYPMQKAVLDGAGNILTEFSLENKMVTGENQKTAQNADGITQALTAPALRNAGTVQNLNFDFTASDNSIYIKLNDLPSRLHGNTLNFTIKNVRDNYDNLSESITWSAEADFNTLSWEKDGVTSDVDTRRLQETEFTTTLRNVGNQSAQYELTNLPSWISASPSSGTIGVGGSETITLRILSSAPVGEHDVLIYARNSDNIYTPLSFSVEVMGNQPNWSVDKSKYETTMNMVGQIYINDKICHSSSTMIGAFIGNECRGVAYPQLLESRDSYYVDLTIYGHDGGAKDGIIQYRIYDSSKGIVYSNVGTDIDGQYLVVKYIPNDIKGSYSRPVRWTCGYAVEQAIELPTGWNWMSIYVDPYVGNETPESIFGHDGVFKNLVSKSDGFAYCNGSEWQGTLSVLSPGNMYKVRVTDDAKAQVLGGTIDVRNKEVTMYKGWNWIGSLSVYNLGLDEAFADLNCADGDAIKSKTQIAFFNGQKWEGQLRAIIPGDGYYFYNSGPTRTFHYPAVDGSNRSPVKAPAEQGWMPFTPVDHHMFSDNMNVIAQVRDGNQAIDTLAIGAFVGGECRGAVRCTGGLYYLTIAGNTNENNLPIELHAFIDGEERVIDNDLVFVVDVIVGTPDAPYVININGSGVDDMTVADARIRITPTVTQGPVTVSTGEGLAAVRLYSASGALLESHNPHGAESLDLDLAGRDNGFYIVEAVSMNGQRRSQRVVRSPR